jgi:hypothetical protein
MPAKHTDFESVTAVTTGELVELLAWATHNLTPSVTREMPAGHLRDVVDEGSDFWDFRKMVGFSA